jgi:hypothetical protein
MGKYNGAIITSAGQNLIAQAIAQGQTVTFTTMQASSNAYPSSTDFEALTSLIDVEATADISYAGVYNNNVVQISARIDNTGVETAYLINTLGVFAQVGSATPILLAVITAVTPDQMPVYDANNPSAFIYNVQITVQNAESISVSVNPAGTINVDQFNQAINGLQTQIATINDNAFFTTDSATTTINNEDYIPIQQTGGKKKTLFSTLVAKLNGLITKIGTSTLGGSNTPIYLNNGTPTRCNELAPKSHASTGTGYGIGNGSNYGHIKLSDTYNNSVSDGGASGGLGASQNALYNAYSTLNNNKMNYQGPHCKGTLSDDNFQTDSTDPFAKQVINVNQDNHMFVGNAVSCESLQLEDKYRAATLESLMNKPPKNHASTSTDYGVASSSKYGHVKTSTGINNSDGTISVAYGSAAGTACQGNDSRLSNSRTPTSHASTGTGYGGGNATNYGHVKLSDEYSSNIGDASSSTGASQKALFSLYANTEQELNAITNVQQMAITDISTGHTTLEAAYNAPADGYIVAMNNDDNLNGLVQVYVAAATGDFNVAQVRTHLNPKNDLSLFVKKGCRIYVRDRSSIVNIYFRYFR